MARGADTTRQLPIAVERAVAPTHFFLLDWRAASFGITADGEYPREVRLPYLDWSHVIWADPRPDALLTQGRPVMGVLASGYEGQAIALDRTGPVILTGTYAGPR